MISPAVMLSGLLPVGITGGDSGWQLKIGRLVDQPDQVVIFYDTGGQSPNPAWLVDFAMVMVHVRGAVNDYPTAYQKAKEVKDALLGIESQDVSGDRLVSIICMGDIGLVSYDDAQRPLFSINFRMIIEPAASALTQREPL